jgi:hypothetical protein
MVCKTMKLRLGTVDLVMMDSTKMSVAEAPILTSGVI